MCGIALNPSKVFLAHRGHTRIDPFPRCCLIGPSANISLQQSGFSGRFDIGARRNRGQGDVAIGVVRQCCIDEHGGISRSPC